MKRTVWPCRTALIAMPDGPDRTMRPQAGTRRPHLTTASEASKQSDKSLPIIPHLQSTERQGPWTHDYILCPLTLLIGLSHEWMALAAGRKPYSLRPDKAQVDAQQRRPALRGMAHRGRTYMPAAPANLAQGLRRRRPHSPKPARIAGPGILHAYRNVHRMAAGPAHDILIQGPTAIAEAPPEPLPQPVFIDRYVHLHHRCHRHYPTTGQLFLLRSLHAACRQPAALARSRTPFSHACSSAVGYNDNCDCARHIPTDASGWLMAMQATKQTRAEGVTCLLGESSPPFLQTSFCR